MVLDGNVWYFRTHIKKVQKKVELLCLKFAVYRQNYPTVPQILPQTAAVNESVDRYQVIVQSNKHPKSLILKGNKTLDIPDRIVYTVSVVS